MLNVMFIFTVFGQKASVSMDNKSILIGDQKAIKLQFAFPSDLKFTWPVFPDSLSNHVEIVDRSKVDTLASSDKKNLTLSQILKITSFDSGSWTIPPFTFSFYKPNDTTQFVSFTDSLLLNVSTMAVDTTKQIRDIKEPFEQGLTFAEILPYLLAALGIIMITILVIYFLRRRRKGQPFISFPEKPLIPAHEIALQELENLRLKKLWQNEKVKEYYTELTGIVRIYLLNRFGIEAMEMTSDEILHAVTNADINKTEITKLKQLLLLADLVKFAKEQPLPDQHDLSITYAKEFVKSTAIIEEKIKETKTENQEE